MYPTSGCIESDLQIYMHKSTGISIFIRTNLCMHAAQCSSSSIVLCASVTVVELPGKDWTSSSKRR